MDEMKLFIGTKIVRAVPRTRKEFEATKDQPYEDREDEPGYMVQYEDGYTSWSPKATFDRAYREVTEAEKQLLA